MNLNMETRNLVDGAELRVEQTDNGLRFSGYAAMFDSPSSPLPFTERIAPKAFADSLSRAARGEWVIKLLHGHDASQMLADRSQRHLPVLTIALTVGYQSITPFNTAFRQMKGVTPTEFRKRALQESALGQAPAQATPQRQ